ncbi:hypothetical protein HA397_30655, partial [Escherichia coli]|nr:hypothetical protein [Escherichia coli]
YLLNMAGQRQADRGNISAGVALLRQAFDAARAVGNRNELAFAQSQAFLLGEEIGDTHEIEELARQDSATALMARVRRMVRTAAKAMRPQPTDEEK